MSAFTELPLPPTHGISSQYGAGHSSLELERSWRRLGQGLECGTVYKQTPDVLGAPDAVNISEGVAGCLPCRPR